LAKLGVGESRAGGWRVGFWFWVGSECIMSAGYGRGAIRGGFERGFLGFVEVISLLAKANLGE
jgi:hypothetical protein